MGLKSNDKVLVETPASGAACARAAHRMLKLKLLKMLGNSAPAARVCAMERSGVASCVPFGRRMESPYLTLLPSVFSSSLCRLFHQPPNPAVRYQHPPIPRRRPTPFTFNSPAANLRTWPNRRLVSCGAADLAAASNGNAAI